MKMHNKKFIKVNKGVVIEGKAKMRVKNDDINHKGLTCNCGHCHSNLTKNTNKDGENSKFSQYFFDFFKIGLSVCFLLLALFLPINWKLKLVLYITAGIIVGYDLAIRFVKNIIKLRFFDENSLMLIASVTAYLLGEYFEGAFMLILFNIGELLESVATKTARKKIAGLANLRAVTVHLFNGDHFTEVKPEEVNIGSILIIKKGEQIPIDCKLLSGSAVLDLKAITGESRPCTVKEGCDIYSGAINVGDLIKVATTKLYKDSMVEKIISSVEGATAKKAKSQKFITSFAKLYTPIVVIAGIIIAVIPPFFDGLYFAKWIYRALTFLVVSCPCALVISVPLAFYIGIGNLARKGILVKGSNYIDLISRAKVAIFDKTGTLTEGHFSVEEINVKNGFNKKFVLTAACSLENASNHPLATAIVSYAKNKGINPINCNVFERVGKGVSSIIDNKNILVGSDKFLLDNGIAVCESQYEGDIVYVAVDGKLAAEIFLTDKIKVGAHKCISKLRRLSIKTIILSGDRKSVAEKAAKELKIDYVYSGLLPDEKLAKLKEIKNNINSPLIYLGDGINDAPSLAAADVGIAMGGLGSQAAIEGADLVFMDDDVSKLITAINQSKKIKRIVTLNIILSLITKFLVIGLGVFFSLPVWIAIFADVGVMLLAVANSLTAGC